MTIDEQIKKADAKIAEIEAALIVAQEHRRELVNRGNLNKCPHNRLVAMPGFWISEGNPANRNAYDFCPDCGARL